MKPIANTLREQIALIDVNKPVQVYRNLQRKMWSVKQGVVRFHTELTYLVKCEFIVNERGRQRVLAEKRKNVHGFVKGKLHTRKLNRIAKAFESGDINLIDRFFESVYYDPYTCEQFMSGNSPILESGGVIMVISGDTALVYSLKTRK